MELTDDVVRPLMRAGADALAFNSPMSADRAADIVERILAGGGCSVVDLGCGRGTLVRMLCSRAGTITAVGVDSDADVVAAASEVAAVEGLSDRLRYEVGDVLGFGWLRLHR